MDQLRTQPKAAVCNNIGNWMKDNLTLAQIMAWLLDTEVIADTPTCTYNEQGKQTSQIDVACDLVTGLQSSKRMITWTYYPTNEVDEIEIKTFDAGDTLIAHKKIKHYKDGRYPKESDMMGGKK